MRGTLKPSTPSSLFWSYVVSLLFLSSLPHASANLLRKHHLCEIIIQTTTKPPNYFHDWLQIAGHFLLFSYAISWRSSLCGFSFSAYSSSHTVLWKKYTVCGHIPISIPSHPTSVPHRVLSAVNPVLSQSTLVAARIWLIKSKTQEYPLIPWNLRYMTKTKQPNKQKNQTNQKPTNQQNKDLRKYIK